MLSTPKTAKETADNIKKAKKPRGFPLVIGLLGGDPVAYVHTSGQPRGALSKLKEHLKGESITKSVTAPSFANVYIEEKTVFILRPKNQDIKLIQKKIPDLNKKFNKFLNNNKATAGWHFELSEIDDEDESYLDSTIAALPEDTGETTGFERPVQDETTLRRRTGPTEAETEAAAQSVGEPELQPRELSDSEKVKIGDFEKLIESSCGVDKESAVQFGELVGGRLKNELALSPEDAERRSAQVLDVVLPRVALMMAARKNDDIAPYLARPVLALMLNVRDVKPLSQENTIEMLFTAACSHLKTLDVEQVLNSSKSDSYVYDPADADPKAIEAMVKKEWQINESRKTLPQYISRLIKNTAPLFANEEGLKGLLAVTSSRITRDQLLKDLVGQGSDIGSVADSWLADSGRFMSEWRKLAGKIVDEANEIVARTGEGTPMSASEKSEACSMLDESATEVYIRLHRIMGKQGAGRRKAIENCKTSIDSLRTLMQSERVQAIRNDASGPALLGRIATDIEKVSGAVGALMPPSTSPAAA